MGSRIEKAHLRIKIGAGNLFVNQFVLDIGSIVASSSKHSVKSASRVSGAQAGWMNICIIECFRCWTNGEQRLMDFTLHMQGSVAWPDTFVL